MPRGFGGHLTNMHITTITCDRCKKVATTKEEKDAQEIMRVGVGVLETYRHSGQDSFRVQDCTHTAEWCRACRDELKLNFHRKDEKTSELPAAPTLEDIIREIAYDTAKEAIGNHESR